MKQTFDLCIVTHKSIYGNTIFLAIRDMHNRIENMLIGLGGCKGRSNVFVPFFMVSNRKLIIERLNISFVRVLYNVYDLKIQLMFNMTLFLLSLTKKNLYD